MGKSTLVASSSVVLAGLPADFKPAPAKIRGPQVVLDAPRELEQSEVDVASAKRFIKERPENTGKNDQPKRRQNVVGGRGVIPVVVSNLAPRQ